MYGSIRRYRIRSGSVNDIIDRVRDGLLPKLQQMSGFVGYYIINADANRATSFTMGESREAVDEMNRVALKWVNENLPDRLSEPEVIAGPVPVAASRQNA